MKRIQWVAVSVCFVLAVALWFLVTLNKQTYTTAFDVPIKLVNFPDNYQLREEFPNEMRIIATGPGIKLLYQDFDPARDTIHIDFEAYREQGRFDADKNLKVLSQPLKEDVVAIGAEPESINLAYAVKSSRRVPLRLDVEFDLPPSFRIPENSIGYPDSILVVGPADSLQRLKECKTRHIKLPFSTKVQEALVPVDSLRGMQIIPKEVLVRYQPMPYTEMFVSLPVQVTDMPAGTTVQLSPDSIRLKILVPLDKANYLNRIGITAEVAFSKLDPRSPSVVPSVRNLPATAELISFQPQLLRYVIVTHE